MLFKASPRTSYWSINSTGKMGAIWQHSQKWISSNSGMFQGKKSVTELLLSETERMKLYSNDMQLGNFGILEGLWSPLNDHFTHRCNRLQELTAELLANALSPNSLHAFPKGFAASLKIRSWSNIRNRKFQQFKEAATAGVL